MLIYKCLFNKRACYFLKEKNILNSSFSELIKVDDKNQTNKKNFLLYYAISHQYFDNVLN